MPGVLASTTRGINQLIGRWVSLAIESYLDHCRSLSYPVLDYTAGCGHSFWRLLVFGHILGEDSLLQDELLSQYDLYPLPRFGLLGSTQCSEFDSL